MRRTLNHLILALLAQVVFQTNGAGQSSYIYFQNNTDQELIIESMQSGGNTLSSSYWDATTDTLYPWQLTTEGLRVNRTTGITNGEDFYFDVLVHNNVDTVILQMKLTGSLIDSDMWHSAKGNGFDHGWYGDGSFYEEQFTFGGKPCVLKYKAELNGLYDDITYVLHDTEPYVTPDESSNPDVLTILTYNIYMLSPPISFSDQDVRAERMVHSISEYDVVLIQEAFDNDARIDYLVPGLSTVYPYHTDILDIPGTANEDGGVMIFSKYPITLELQHYYENCYSYECLTNKGFTYARIEKLGKPYHVIATHTQAFISEVEVSTRKAQIQEIRHFIDTLGIPTNEPLIVGGDMNVDYYANHYGEYDSMYIYLDAVEPPFTGHMYTFQPDLSYYATSGPDELLDYLLPIATHGMPTSFFNETRILRQVHDDMWGLFDMSDHLAVYGRFEYPQNLSNLDLEVDHSALYPNPTTGIVNISHPDVISVEVYNLQGQLLTTLVPTGIIDITNLPNGTYIMQFVTPSLTYVEKIVKTD
jgi:endonuclease/exonuclease/phosphatase family metal-dependent hydrolase